MNLSKNKNLIPPLSSNTSSEDIPFKASCADGNIPNLYTHNKIIIICSIATTLGFFSLPYGYYTLLKLLFFGSLIYFAFEYQKNNVFTGSTLAVLSVLIILYNPIFPVALGSKPLWILVNLSTIGYLYWLSGVIQKSSLKPL